MKIILFGPPGSGKGTQSKLISNFFKLKIISPGDLLRKEIKNKSTIGKKIEKIQNSGKLIQDNIILNLIKNEMSNNIIFDGFPRTLRQATFLKENNVKIDCIINIILDHQIIINRIKFRLIHEKSGRIYNTI